MTEQEIIDYLLKQEWTFAKTMAKTPHWYIVRDRLKDKTGFDEAVKLIQSKGYQEMFFKKAYIYLNIGEHKYWALGNSPTDITVINRALIKNK
jgi:hypothetical protein